jgi:hypothetical protein
MTLGEAAPLLDPPVTAEQLQRIIAQLPSLNPAGTKPHGRPGPPYLLYDLDEVMELHAALARWLPYPAVQAQGVAPGPPGAVRASPQG